MAEVVRIRGTPAEAKIRQPLAAFWLGFALYLLSVLFLPVEVI